MGIGFWQLLIIVYILFLAIGPRRVVHWSQWSIDTWARVWGRPPPPRKRWGWLSAIQLLENSRSFGWACIAAGSALAFLYLYLSSQGSIGAWGVPILLLAMAFLFIGPWLL